jgi:hypothetical protein
VREWDGVLSKVRMASRNVGIKTERYGDGETMAGREWAAAVRYQN